MKTLHLISFLIVLISCSKSREPETHLIPKSRIGTQIIVNFGQDDGAPKKYMGSRRLYEIPDSGALETKFETNFGWFDEEDIKFILVDGDSLQTLPWDYHNDTIGFFRTEKGNIGVMGLFLGQQSLSYVLDTVDLNLFYRKKLYQREDIFGKPNLDSLKRQFNGNDTME
jgi:hypothetical protein